MTIKPPTSTLIYFAIIDVFLTSDYNKMVAVYPGNNWPLDHNKEGYICLLLGNPEILSCPKHKPVVIKSFNKDTRAIVIYDELEYEVIQFFDPWEISFSSEWKPELAAILKKRETNGQIP